MTIDEAIAHAEEVATTTKCKECAEEHRQLAEWLKELKEKKQAIEDIKEEFRLINATYVYKFFGYDEIIDIIDRHIGKEKEDADSN